MKIPPKSYLQIADYQIPLYGCVLLREAMTLSKIAESDNESATVCLLMLQRVNKAVTIEDVEYLPVDIVQQLTEAFLAELNGSIKVPLAQTTTNSSEA
jgi:hypothetical protein